MKNAISHVALVVAAFLCVCVVSAQAAILLYDGFAPNATPTGPYNYAPGQPLAASPDPNAGNPNGQFNASSTFGDKYWRYAGGGTANTAAPGIASTTGSLFYPGLPLPTGNKVSFDTTQLGSARIQVASAINAGTVYWSGLLRVSAFGSPTQLNSVNGILLGGFNNTPGPGGLPTAVGAVLRVRRDPTDGAKFDIGTAMNSGTGAGNIQWSSAFTPSSTGSIFIVGAYEFVAGSSNDKAYMWINPAVNTFSAASPPAATLTSTPALADSFASLSTFTLRNVNTVGSLTAAFDELRVGTNWASVTPVPEATSFLIVVLGGIFAIASIWMSKRLGINVLKA